MKKSLLYSLVALSVAYGANANAADSISINDTNLGAISVTTLDWSPGSALAVDAVPVAASPSTTTFDLYTQASLGNYLDSTSNVINGTGLNTDYELTFQAGFTEIGTTFAAGTVATFSLDPSATVNFFNIYYDTSIDANALTGTGYGDGALVLSAVLIGNNTIFQISDGTPVILDNFGANDYLGYYTVTGQGGGQLAADVTGLNQQFNFFNDSTLASLIVQLAFNSSNITPFQQVDPSASVVGNAINLSFFDSAACTAQGIALADQLPGGGCYINGIDNSVASADFLFQADANQSFTLQSVPEPESIALLGLGLLGFGISRLGKQNGYKQAV